MTMNGIDISNYQSGINLREVPADFVIVKATEGNYYISGDFKRQTNQVIETGKCLGFYHYANGGDAIQEANFFINAIKDYIRQGILVLDWESQNNPLFGVDDFNWCKQWCDYVANKTGVKPIVYIQKSAMDRVKGIGDYGLWIAQYADMNPTGYQNEPWQEGAYECVIRQYSSCGQLNGYSGYLDLDKAYINREEWNKYAGKTESAPVVNNPMGSTLDLVVATLQGCYGNGDARKGALGSRYNEVQNFINHIANAGAYTLASEVMNGNYGNGDTRKVVLGSRYEEVQNIINNEFSVVYHVVEEGENLSTIAAKYGTDYLTIAQMNGIVNPNIIYPGQKLIVK